MPATALETAPFQPFPAGPVIPPTSPLLPGLGARQRAQLALALLIVEHGRTYDQRNPKTPFTTLIADGTLEWALHHPNATARLDASAVKSEHPASAVLHGWLALGVASRDTQAEQAVVDFTKRLNNRHNRGRDTLQADLPYRPGSLGVAGSPATPAGTVAMPATPAAVAGNGHPAVDEMLAKPGGGWLLLALYFLKQLHGHLGWQPNRNNRAEAAHALYDPVLRLLTLIARTRSADRHAAAAAGLASALPHLAPYWQLAGAGAYRPDDLPGCFVPEALAPADAIRRQALRHLQRRPRLQAQLAAVHALAQDVAASLTDLAVAARIDLVADDHGYLANHYIECLWQWKQVLKSQVPTETRASPAFARDALMPRMHRLRALASWMHVAGAQAVRAAQAGVLQALPMPAAPSRLGQGEAA